MLLTLSDEYFGDFNAFMERYCSIEFFLNTIVSMGEWIETETETMDTICKKYGSVDLQNGLTWYILYSIRIAAAAVDTFLAFRVKW